IPPRAAKCSIARPASHTSWFMEFFQCLQKCLTLEHSSRRAASSQVVMHSGRVRRRTKDRDLPSWKPIAWLALLHPAQLEFQVEDVHSFPRPVPKNENNQTI